MLVLQNRSSVLKFSDTFRFTKKSSWLNSSDMVCLVFDICEIYSNIQNEHIWQLY